MHVYLSYTTAQKAIARTVRKALAAHGVEVWPDGDSGRKERYAAIHDASAFVAIVSAAYLSSQLTHQELAVVRQARKPVAAVVAEQDFDIESSEELQTLIQPPVISLAREGYRQLVEMPCIPSTRPFSADRLPINGAIEASQRTRRPRPAFEKKDVFISYAMEDFSDAAAIRSALVERSISYWDFKATARRYDKPLIDELEQALEQCRVFVAILSDPYHDSDWSCREFCYAMDQEVNLPILAVRFRPHRPRFMSSGRTVIDCITSKQQGLYQLGEAVSRLLTN